MPEADLISLFAVPLERAGLPYMITGAAAAILYGQPRTTNDLDVVIELKVTDLPRLRTAFPEKDYYLPPDEVIAVELGRAQRGHLNALHHDSGLRPTFTRWEAIPSISGRSPIDARCLMAGRASVSPRRNTSSSASWSISAKAARPST